MPQNTRGKLISLATEADRTLYFDFLPINIGTINDFQAKFQLYTVPGQVYYNATRKLVLRGVDGLVFVADSQADKMDENIESLANLEENLREYGYDINQLPLVLQFNKRDLPNVLSVQELNARLNPRGLPFFEASAPSGKGVFDTLKLIIKLVLDKAKSAGSSAMSQRAAPPPAEAAPYPSGERVAAAPQPTAETIPTRTDSPQPVTAAPDWRTAAQPAASEWNAPSQPTVAVAPDPAFRPYPGSDRQMSAERRTGRVPVVSAPRELPAASLEKNIGSDSREHATGAGSMNTPQMAPSLRRRAANKKRSFFKRLFGIK
ncbi:MAG: ADP-ribosylation factor-like protein [Candidatus Zixiibacteriota bacterium]